MKQVISKVRPASGFARVAHFALLSLLPMLVFVLVNIELAYLALAIILLSKWRMFAVKPRFWPANVRANSIDIIVGLAIFVFITQTAEQSWQLFWTVLYIAWLMAIKPRSETLMIALQALIGFIAGLAALFLVADNHAALFLVLGAGLVCYLAAHHFLDAFEEGYTRLLAYIWGFFGAALTWVLAHWLLYYPANGLISQPMLLLLTVGYGLAAIYYLDHTERLSGMLRKQFIFIMVAVIVIILVFSDWSAKII